MSHINNCHYWCNNELNKTTNILNVLIIVGGKPQVVPAEVPCPDPSVANGVKLSEADSVYRVGDSVTFTCSEGFLLTGAQQLTCGPDGQWQPQLPLCHSSDITQSSKPDGKHNTIQDLSLWSLKNIIHVMMHWYYTRCTFYLLSKWSISLSFRQM